MSYSNNLGPKFDKVSEKVWLEEIAKSCKTYAHQKALWKLVDLWVEKWKRRENDYGWAEWRGGQIKMIAYKNREDRLFKLTWSGV